MAQNYEDIVRDWYLKLQTPFLRQLTSKYPALTIFDAENIYQDTFLAVQNNLLEGRIKEDTSWSSYIMTIGLNMASKAYQKIGKTDSADDGFDNDGEGSKSKTAREVEKLVKNLSEEETPLYENEEALSLLGDELTHTPEPCGSIIRLFYYTNMSMDEIATKIGYKNATTAKAKKSQCMSDLINRVTCALRNAGFDVKPKKRNRNGKN